MIKCCVPYGIPCFHLSCFLPITWGVEHMSKGNTVPEVGVADLKQLFDQTYQDTRVDLEESNGELEIYVIGTYPDSSTSLDVEKVQKLIQALQAWVQTKRPKFDPAKISYCGGEVRLISEGPTVLRLRTLASASSVDLSPEDVDELINALKSWRAECPPQS